MELTDNLDGLLEDGSWPDSTDDLYGLLEDGSRPGSMDNLDGLQSISLDNAVQSSSSSSIQDKAIRILMSEVSTTVKKSAPVKQDRPAYSEGLTAAVFKLRLPILCRVLELP